ncbi:Fur family transcriptional regulator [Streptomyces sp. NPDC048182]|uniref:Fur family transcriptional regulator n=1 Tax=Streptomyces sp. NPDC048182 TaxID=3365507 RepID=UPI00372283A3
MHGSALGNQRSTRQRRELLTLFQTCDDFVSARSLHSAAESAGIEIGLTTVYRTLRILEADGGADVIRDVNGERLYRPRPDEGHQHYVVCRECGLSRAVEAEQVERWAQGVAATTGFTGIDHVVELTGVCGDCTDEARPGPR